MEMDPDSGSGIYDPVYHWLIFFLDIGRYGSFTSQPVHPELTAGCTGSIVRPEFYFYHGWHYGQADHDVFLFSLFKYLFLILGSPVFSYLSEKTESIIEGKEFVFSKSALFFHDIRRGIRLAIRNCFWQTVYTIFILLLSFIPLVGSIAPVISGLVECYYYGFSMLDYSCERHKLSPSASINFISQRRGLAIGNGLVFYLMHFVPFVGWVLAPSYALVAATISLYHQNIDS